MSSAPGWSTRWPHISRISTRRPMAALRETSCLKGKRSIMKAFPARRFPPSCHGQDAHGMDQFPRLAGQLDGYLIAKLVNWPKERGKTQESRQFGDHGAGRRKADQRADRRGRRLCPRPQVILRRSGFDTFAFEPVARCVPHRPSRLQPSQVFQSRRVLMTHVRARSAAARAGARLACRRRSLSPSLCDRSPR